MDFPVCPACGQSVIDDDAEDCPFCGSSMKAKPGAKPTAPKPGPAAGSKPGVSGSKPGATSTAKPTTPAKPVTGGKAGSGKGNSADDFPFENDLPSGSSAIQAMPMASKQRSLQVICPMCETAGYVVPSAAGQDVKCANPKCLVPVFKAPVPKVEAPPPPPKKSNLPVILGGVVGVAALGFAGIFVLPGLLATKPKVKPVDEDAQALMREMAGGSKSNPTKSGNGMAETAKTEGKSSDGTGGNKSSTGDATPGSKSVEQQVADAAKLMDDLCLIGDRRQRSKAFCRQLAAEANAIAGNAAQFTENINQLDVVGKDVPYFRILPNLEEFWRAWSANDKAAATKSLDLAYADKDKIPKVGRNQHEIAGRLATALAVAGRVSDGITLVQQHQAADGHGQLAARIQLATDGHVAPLTHARSVLAWTAPQAVAVTGSLMARGQAKVAREWAEAQSSEDAKVECLSIWAESVARTQAQPAPASSNAEIVEAVKGLAPHLAARVWARAACGRLIAKDADGTAATIKIASELLSKTELPAEPTMPEVKQTIKYEVPVAGPLVQAATSAGELAFVQALSGGNLKDAEATLELALQFARGLGPGYPAASMRANEAAQAGPSGLQAMLKKELTLKTDDDARQAMGKYRRSLGEIVEAAKLRFDLQTRLLSRMTHVGLMDKAWLVASTRSADEDPNKRDDFLNSSLPSDLLEAFKGTETAQAIRSALGENAVPVRPIEIELQELVDKGEFPAAIALLAKVDNRESLRDDFVLSNVSRLAASGKHDQAFAFIGALGEDNKILREDSYRTVAALAAQRGQADAVWKLINQAPQATEKSSLCRGLIAGLKATPPVDDLPASRSSK